MIVDKKSEVNECALGKNHSPITTVSAEVVAAKFVTTNVNQDVIQSESVWGLYSF